MVKPSKLPNAPSKSWNGNHLRWMPGIRQNHSRPEPWVLSQIFDIFLLKPRYPDSIKHRTKAPGCINYRFLYLTECLQHHGRVTFIPRSRPATVKAERVLVDVFPKSRQYLSHLNIYAGSLPFFSCLNFIDKSINSSSSRLVKSIFKMI